MYCGETLFDVMGPDILAENDIAAKFTDNDEELFDANEFIDPNQGPNLDMSLNFQARQA